MGQTPLAQQDLKGDTPRGLQATGKHLPKWITRRGEYPITLRPRKRTFPLRGPAKDEAPVLKRGIPPGGGPRFFFEGRKAQV